MHGGIDPLRFGEVAIATTWGNDFHQDMEKEDCWKWNMEYGKWTVNFVNLCFFVRFCACVGVCVCVSF